MNISRPAAALAALVLSSGCSDDAMESSRSTQAFAPDTSPDLPRLSSDTSQEVSAACTGFTLTAMQDEKTGITPMNQTVIQGDQGVELGCWHIKNPCDKPLVMTSATFTRGGISTMGQFTERYIPKVADVRVIDKQKNTVTFPDAPMTFPAHASWDFCVAGSVPADALCNTPTTYSVANAEDLNMTYDGKHVTTGDFVDTDFPVVGGKTTVACGTKFMDVVPNTTTIPPSSAPIGSTVNCLSVDISSNGNYETILQSLQIDVERQGLTPASAEGGLLDTSSPDQTVTNVGPIAITKTIDGDSTPVGVTLAFYGNDDTVQWPHTLGDLEAAKLSPQIKQTLTFSVGISKVTLLIGEKIRCIFKSKPVIASVALNGIPFKLLDPALIGPEKDIVGPWMTITEK